MDPAWQTLLTLFCMLLAWFWGMKLGIEKGSIACWHVIVTNLDLTDLSLDDDGKLTFFRDGKKLNPKDAWKDE